MRRRRGPHAATGRWGERLARRYLCRRGLRVLGRNVELGHGELDLVAEAADGTLVVVEVKAGLTFRGLGPERRVDHVKRRQLITLTRALIHAKRWHGRPWRIDVITVTGRRPRFRPLEWVWIQAMLRVPADRRPEVSWFRGVVSGV